MGINSAGEHSICRTNVSVENSPSKVPASESEQILNKAAAPGEAADLPEDLHKWYHVIPNWSLPRVMKEKRALLQIMIWSSLKLICVCIMCQISSVFLPLLLCPLTFLKLLTFLVSHLWFYTTAISFFLVFYSILFYYICLNQFFQPLSLKLTLLFF